MLKKLNKRFSFVFALLFALTMIVPFAPSMASAATSTTSLSIPSVKDGTNSTLGTVFMQFTGGQLKNGSTCTISLPQNFQFLTSVPALGTVNGNTNFAIPTNTLWAPSGSVDGGTTNGTVLGATYSTYGDPSGNYFSIPLFNGSTGSQNALAAAGVTLTVQEISNNQVSVTVNDPNNVLTNANVGYNGYLYLYLNNIYVDSGYNGALNVTVSAPGNSGFSSGTVQVATVNNNGSVTVTCTNAPAFTDSDFATLNITENVAGSLKPNSTSLKFTLPNGFSWGNSNSTIAQLASSGASLTVFWGDAQDTANVDTNGNVIDMQGSTLASYLANCLTVTGSKSDQLILNLPSGFASSQAISFQVIVPISVYDETVAQLGDVNATVTGNSSTGISTLFVGKYGTYDTTITAGTPTTVIAGMLSQYLPDITIAESSKASLVDGRTVILTLPSGYAWQNIDQESSNGVSLTFQGFPAKDGRTAKWAVSGTSSSAASLDLKDMEVAVQPGTSGPLVIAVTGTAGVSGNLTVANTVTPVTITAGSSQPLTIGAANQSIGDITITENAADALCDAGTGNLDLALPSGVRWASYGSVTVTSGDMTIKSDSITLNSSPGNSDDILEIPIDRSSSATASTIVISSPTITLDRTVPEGDVTLKAQGDAVAQVNIPSEVQGQYDNDGSYYTVNGNQCISSLLSNSYYSSGVGALFPSTTTGASAVVGTVGTPAPTGQTPLTTTITLGDNGSYISNGRIMVQLRDAATALGVTGQNLLWDNASKTATMLKDNQVVQITVGNPSVKLNGTALPTDQGAEIKDGRTFISLSMAGIAFGAVTTWDNTSKTATITVGGTATTTNSTTATTSSTTATTTVNSPVINAVAAGNTTVSGTGVTGDTITITNPNGTTSTTTVDANGNWLYSVPTALNAGDTVSAVQQDVNGNTSSSVSASVPAATTTTTTVNAPVISALSSGSMSVSGTGTPGDTVVVTDQNGTMLNAVVDNNGNWTCNISTALALGNMISAVQQDTNGNSSSSVSATVMQ